MPTVPDAVIWPNGASAGSLQVVTGSEFRAAGCPPIFTVTLPMNTLPWFDGGF